MGVIAALADDVIVMRNGEIVERGSVAQILQAPPHDYTRALLAATPRIDASAHAAGIDHSIAATTPESRPLVVRELHVHHGVRAGWRRPREVPGGRWRVARRGGRRSARHRR